MAPIDSATPQRILEAAGPIFAEKGFESTTVREICSAAAANLASINYHFGDKEQLYIAAVTSARQSRAEQVPLPQWDENTPAEIRLGDFVQTMLKRMLGAGPKQWQVRLIFREILHPTEACKGLVQEYFRPFFQVLLTIIADLVPSDTDPRAIEKIGFSIAGQCFFYRAAGSTVRLVVGRDSFDEEFSIDMLAAHITRFSLAALENYKNPLFTPDVTSDRPLPLIEPAS